MQGELHQRFVSSSLNLSIDRTHNSRRRLRRDCWWSGHLYVRFLMLVLKRLPIAICALALSCLLACVSEQRLGVHATRSSSKWAEPEVTSLHKAIRTGDVAAVTKVLKAKGNANAVAENGATPLYALFQGSPFPGGEEIRYQIALALFRVGADPNEYLPHHLSAGGVRAATWALHKGSGKIAKLFLEAGLDPALQDDSGSSMLFVAVSVDSIEAADLLLSAGTSINHIDKFRQNCLFLASTPEMGKFLVQRGVNIHQRNDKDVSVVAKLRDQSGYCGSGGCSEIPAEELALANYLQSIGAPP